MSLLFCQFVFGQHPNLDSILKSSELSFLVHNHVASHNPKPHGWEKFTHAQSPLGRFVFPQIMAMNSGEVYSLQDKGLLTQHTTTSQNWLPWLFEAENNQIKVRRTVGKDIFISEVISSNDKNVAILNMNSFTDYYYRDKNDISLTFDKPNQRFIFKWKDYSLLVSISGAYDINMSSTSQPLLRKFQGYNDVVFIDKSTIGCWNRNGDIFIGASFNKKLTITFEVTKTPENPRLPDFMTSVDSEKRYWTDFFNKKVPLLKTNDKIIKETYYNAWVSLWSNCWEGGDGLTPYSYIASSPFMYPSQFFWDEFHHSIILSNLKDTEIPYQFIKNMAAIQAPDGGIPGSFNFTQDFNEYFERVAKTGSTDMQPLLIGVTLEYLKKKPGWSSNKIEILYNTFNRYITWLYTNRDLNKNGLVEYTNSYQSGTDDSPRFDNLYPQGNHIGNMQPIETLEQNVWLSLMHYHLSEMANKLGKANESKIHAQKALTIEKLLEKDFWNETDGMYYDINTVTHQQIKVKTEFTFMSMFLRNARKERIKRLVNEHLLNPNEFWLAYPVPSVAMSESSFTKDIMWRGPVWPNINWLICLGLEKQGYTDVAKELALKTVRMVGPQYKDNVCVRSARFNEWFNPITGEAYGNENVSWTTCVTDLIIRFLDK